MNFAAKNVFLRPARKWEDRRTPGSLNMSAGQGGKNKSRAGGDLKSTRTDTVRRDPDPLATIILLSVNRSAAYPIDGERVSRLDSKKVERGN